MPYLLHENRMTKLPESPGTKTQDKNREVSSNEFLTHKSSSSIMRSLKCHAVGNKLSDFPSKNLVVFCTNGHYFFRVQNSISSCSTVFSNEFTCSEIVLLSGFFTHYELLSTNAKNVFNHK